MAIPSLLADYRNYLNIKKDVDLEFVDLSNIRFVAPASLLPAYYFAMSNSIPKYIPHDHSKDHIKKVLGHSDSNNDLIPIVTKTIGTVDAQKKRLLKNLNKKIRQLIFTYTREYIEYGGIGVFPYITEELLNNVEQHSGANKVYSYSQRYPNEGYIDVGILDNGITIPGKFEQSKPDFDDKDVNPYEFKNDCEAIYRSLNGISTKNLFKRSMPVIESEMDILNNINLSCGINSSVRLITEGLGASFLIASREGICHLTKDGPHFIKVKKENILNGTFVCVRFKKLELNRDEFDEFTSNTSLIEDEERSFNLCTLKGHN